MSEWAIEERPDSLGARRALAGEPEGALAPSLKNLGGHFGAPHRGRWVIEERPDSLGARRALGGVGDHVGAPHVR